MAGHVFISHGSDNRAEADELCAFIESGGVRAWIAPRDVRPGMDYSEELQTAIEGCAAFVVLVTEMANKSPYVRAETEMAFSNSKPIFPVRMSDIKTGAGAGGASACGTTPVSVCSSAASRSRLASRPLP